MTRHYSANATSTTLSAGINDTVTSITVDSTTGFPAADFILALDYGAAEQELVLVTNVAGTTLTVTRGYDSTSAQAHSLGAAVRHVHSAIDFRDSRTHEDASSGIHGVTGSVVGTTDTQTLSNKDLSSGNTFPSSLLTASGSQTVTNKDLSSGTNTFPSSLATDAELSAHASDTTTHGTAGDIVGTSDTQTLSNKDLSASTNSFPSDGIAFVGQIVMDGSTTPVSAKWKLADGSAISRTTYSALFARYGTTYGSGDGSTTFNLPNLTGKMPRGNTPGVGGGSDTVTLTAANLPPHTHSGSTNGGEGTHNHNLKHNSTDGSSATGYRTVSTSGIGGPDSTLTSADGAHTHTFTTGNGPGSSSAVTVTNPYTGLAFMVRVLP